MHVDLEAPERVELYSTNAALRRVALGARTADAPDPNAKPSRLKRVARRALWGGIAVLAVLLALRIRG